MNETNGGPQDIFYSPSPDYPRPTFVRGKGIYLWDDEGNKYLDASSGPATCNIGHSNPRVLRAMQAQAEKLCFSFTSTARNVPNIEFSKQLTQLAGPGFERALFVSGGSLAVDMAIKFCRQYRYATGETSRTKLISCLPSYHGMTLGCLAVSGDPIFDEIYSDMITSASKIEPFYHYRRPEDLSDTEYALSCAKNLERQILKEKENSVLAFIIEPVGGSSTGAISPPEVYFKEIRRICNQYGVFLIYDEVLSGSGRTGTFLTHHQWKNAQPDIVVLAKGLGAGYYPLGAMLTSAALVDEITHLTGFNYAHTYNANPLACAVGLAVLEEFSENNILNNVCKQGKYLRQQLVNLQNQSSIIGDVRGTGLLLAIEFVANKESNEPFPIEFDVTERFKKIALSYGLLIYGRRSNNGKFGEHVLVTPPLNSTEEEIDLIIDKLKLTLDELEQKIIKFESV